MSDHERKASTGKFRVVGEDRFSYEDFFVGEFATKEEAFDAANKGAVEALTDATDSNIADAYQIFDDKGEYLGRGRDFEKISKAIGFAVEAHKNEMRKGTFIPYIVHPLDVLAILLREDANEDLAVAGVLHDVLEDTSRTPQEIAQQFGEGVRDQVEYASDRRELTEGISAEDKKKTWRLRKKEKIEKVKNASGDLKLLLCADQLANIRDLASDYREYRDDVWERFNAPKQDQEWYYRSMMNALGTENGGGISKRAIYKELVVCVEQVFGSKSVQ